MLIHLECGAPCRAFRSHAGSTGAMTTAWPSHRPLHGGPFQNRACSWKLLANRVTLGGPQNGRPPVPQPSLLLGLVEMVRDQPGFLKRKAQIVEQCTDIVPVVEHAELPLDEHPDEDRIPTGGLKAHPQGPGIEQLDPAFLLRRGQLLRATAAVAVDQAVEPP